MIFYGHATQKRTIEIDSINSYFRNELISWKSFSFNWSYLSAKGGIAWMNERKCLRVSNLLSVDSNTNKWVFTQAKLILRLLNRSIIHISYWFIRHWCRYQLLISQKIHCKFLRWYFPHCRIQASLSNSLSQSLCRRGKILQLNNSLSKIS